jgi:hypothetical protein
MLRNDLILLARLKRQPETPIRCDEGRKALIPPGAKPHIQVLIHSEKKWKLPPLILHPFSDAGGPQKLARSSRAGLMLEGLLPRGDMSVDELEHTLLDGRLCEIRMLFYVGKDLSRWIEQCMDFVARQTELRDAGLGFHSFSDLLINDAPGPVREKLSRWGVLDYKAIFSRAIGMYTVFADAPTAHQLGPEFVRNYFRFADQLYACRKSLVAYTDITAANFDFELYASGEYSRMLEREWADGSDSDPAI